MPSGSLDKPQDDASAVEEYFVASPSYEGLLLKELQYIHRKSESNINFFMEKKNDAVLMYVYENQRRHLFQSRPLIDKSNKDFSSDHLLHNDRGALTDETGVRQFPHETLGLAG